jgi:hypothetical protein
MYGTIDDGYVDWLCLPLRYLPQLRGCLQYCTSSEGWDPKREAMFRQPKVLTRNRVWQKREIIP